MEPRLSEMGVCAWQAFLDLGKAASGSESRSADQRDGSCLSQRRGFVLKEGISKIWLIRADLRAAPRILF